MSARTWDPPSSAVVMLDTPGINKAYLTGTIGHDPELRSTAEGKSLLVLSLSTPYLRKIDDVWVDVPDWHRLTFEDEHAEWMCTKGRKGDSLAVEAALRSTSWQDRDNVKHFEIKLVVERVLWLRSIEDALPYDAEGAPPPPSDEDAP